MRIIYAVPIVLAVLICGSGGVYGQELRGAIHRIDDCCNIVSVDRMTNQIVVREIATGRTKTLTIANNELLQQLQPGAAFGPGSIDGLQEAPGVFEPNWAEECCTFRAHAVGQTNAGRAKQLNTAGGMSARGMTVDLGPGVTITLQSLKRLGSRVVRLDFSVRNDTGDRAFMPDYGLFGSYHHSLRHVSVLDYDAGLRYGALVDSEDICACSRGSNLETVGAGQESRYWVQIKAPPVDVNVVSIDFAGRASIDNVPIAP